jgi:hypothetical protein
MLLKNEALPVHLTKSNHERSLEAAKTYELMSAIRQQRRLQRDKKHPQGRQWFALRRLA